MMSTISNFEVDKQKKIFYFNTVGSYTPEEAQKFIEDYQKYVKTINPKEYCLFGDGSGLMASTRDMLDQLKGCLQMYLDTGFKTLLFYNLHGSAKMQILKLVKELNTNKIKMLDTKEDALKEIGF